MLNKEALIDGRYRIKSLIGDGGMANVYLADDEILQREVAVKVLRHQLATDAVFVRRFEREAQSVTALNHPNIVNVYDVGSEGDTHYIVMEYVSGHTLKQLIQNRGHLTVSETVEIMQQILAAVEQAHDFGIIHRDLKPQNMIVRPDGVVKVMDFGIALTQEATSLTQTHSVMGSVQYLSPEQVRGELATNQSDLYELGIVLYEMLTGELPFDGESAVNIVLKHLKDELPDIQTKNPQVPNSLVNVIHRATAKEKQERYPDARAMLTDLETVLNPERLNEPIVTIAVWKDTATTAVAKELEATREIPVMMRKKVDVNHEETKQMERVVLEPSPAMKVADVERVAQVKQPKKKKKWLMPVILLGICIALVGGFLVLANIEKNKKVAVPNVTNLTFSQAEETLTALGLIVSQKVNYAYDDGIAKGKVIVTDPEAGTSVEKNTTVTLTVSEGVEVYMPYVVSKTIDDAQTELKKLNIRTQTVTAFSDQPADVVLSQSIEEGTLVDLENDVVLLTVSKGEEPIYMEDFTGFTKEAVERFAKDNGLEVTFTTKETSSSPAGTVLEQFPASGVKLSKGDTISVILAKKPSSILDSIFPSKPEPTTPEPSTTEPSVSEPSSDPSVSTPQPDASVSEPSTSVPDSSTTDGAAASASQQTTGIPVGNE